jgi:4'-phosphopantetheinyl transferase EntD
MSIVCRLLDDRFAVAEGRLDQMECSTGDLFDGEIKAISNAVAKRQHEFIGGRVMARRAMTKLGLAPQAVFAGSDRAPIWPAGLVGSITHTGAWCAAVVARADEIRSVGIDVAEARSVGPELWRILCTEVEFEWLSMLPAENRELGATALFSAKESVFKAQYPLTRRMLDHQAVEVRLSGDWGYWEGELLGLSDDLAHEPAIVAGRLLIDNGMLATSAIIPIKHAEQIPHTINRRKESHTHGQCNKYAGSVRYAGTERPATGG